MFTKQELDDFWETKPYGEFTKTVKSMKGKKKYKLRTTAYKIKEELIGEEEMVILAKDYSEATSRLNQEKATTSLKRKYGLTSWDTSIRYTFKCLGVA